MSESRSQMSPDTAPWRAVWAVYAQDPPASPVQVLSAIHGAARPMYPAILIDKGTTLVAEHLVRQARLRPLAGPDAAAEMNSLTGRAISSAHVNSFATELAMRAQDRLIMTGLGTNGDPRRPLAAELVAAAIDYLISRDLSGYLGMPGLPNASALNAYKNGVISLARTRAYAAADVARSSGWPALVRAAWGR